MRRPDFITLFGKGAGVAALPGRVQALVAGKEPLFEAGFIVALLAIAIGMRAVGLNGRVDFGGYDEGVYWASLRSMRAGYHLYGQIFSSQPPVFLPFDLPALRAVGLRPCGGPRGGSRPLSSRPGRGVPDGKDTERTPGRFDRPRHFACQSNVSRGVSSSSGRSAGDRISIPDDCSRIPVARPSNRTKRHGVRRYLRRHAIAGCVDQTDRCHRICPAGSACSRRIWHIRHETRACIRAKLLPMTAGLAAAVAAALCILAPFMGSLNAVLQQAVTFHLEAETIALGPRNIDTLRHFFATNAALSMAAVIGALVAILRRDARTIPLAAWLLATLAVLAIHVPLFPHHLLMLIPPLIALIVLGMNGLPDILIAGPGAWRHGAALLMGLLAVTVVLAGIRGDYDYYRDLNARSASAAIHPIARIAADLERATTSDQWIITDAQFVAALANRDTPPWLVDTSSVRILSGHLTAGELLQAGTDPRVHAVLFATGRLTAAPLAGFHDWVAGHFNLLHKYDDGIELWIR
jgi:hypothetical protein